jgi:AmmeMemoRadiSam system protein B
MGTSWIRHPRVAGSFYPRSRDALRAELDRCYGQVDDALIPPGRRGAIGAVAPHAGYIYSGAVAAKVYARLRVPETVVVLSPNHTGEGPRMSIWPGGHWTSPVGDIAIDEPLVDAIVRSCPDLERETLAHQSEHGVEVHVPFILRERPDARLVAIVLGTRDAAHIRGLGRALAEALQETRRDALLLSSSDMNHFEDQATTIAKDRRALERVSARDPGGLLDRCEQEDISMCGVAPTAAILWAGESLGARTASLVDHRTSGDVSGEYDRVVGYAGVILE